MINIPVLLGSWIKTACLLFVTLCQTDFKRSLPFIVQITQLLLTPCSFHPQIFACTNCKPFVPPSISCLPTCIRFPGHLRCPTELRASQEYSPLSSFETVLNCYL